MAEPPEVWLKDEEKKELLRLARETLNHHRYTSPTEALQLLRGTRPPLAGALAAPRPCFVSLFGGRQRLRGCIGCTETDRPLAENVVAYTQHAALRDPRFPPVRAEETSRLSLHISVLGPLVPLASLDQLVLGKHGLVVEAGPRRGLLLAKVALDFGWDRDTFLRHTYDKAGLSEDQPGCRLYYFEEISFSE